MSHVPQLPITVPSSRQRRNFPWLAILLVILLSIALGLGIAYVRQQRAEESVAPPAGTVSLYENPELIVVRNYEAQQAILRAAALQAEPVIWQPPAVPYDDGVRIWRPRIDVATETALPSLPDARPSIWQPPVNTYIEGANIWQPPVYESDIEAGDRDTGAVNPEIRIHERTTSP